MKNYYYLKSLVLGLLVCSMTMSSCSDDEELSPLKTIPNGVKAVDLGLPSGTLWANMNVGAIKEEGYGYYFAWGETEPKSDYSWKTYKWCKGGDSNSLTKYCYDVYGPKSGFNGFTDNKTELDPKDDAAYVNWGHDWRMPSEKQYRELLNSSYTNIVWTKKNGVEGLRITSKTNGNSIFLPAAGFRFDALLCNTGLDGNYLSRTLDSDSPSSARELFFIQDSMRTMKVSTLLRSNGGSVRPVRHE